MWLLASMALADTSGDSCADTGVVEHLAPVSALPVEGSTGVAPNATVLVDLRGDTDDLDRWDVEVEVDGAAVEHVSATACWWRGEGPLRECVVILDPTVDLPREHDIVIVGRGAGGVTWSSAFRTGTALNDPGEGTPSLVVGEVSAVEVPCGGGALQTATVSVTPARPNVDAMDYVLVRSGSEGLNAPVYGWAPTPADGGAFSLDVALPEAGDYCVWVEQVDAAGRHSWASDVVCSGAANDDSGAPKVLVDQCDMALPCACGVRDLAGRDAWSCAGARTRRYGDASSSDGLRDPFVDKPAAILVASAPPWSPACSPCSCRSSSPHTQRTPPAQSRASHQRTGARSPRSRRLPS